MENGVQRRERGKKEETSRGIFSTINRWEKDEKKEKGKQKSRVPTPTLRH